MCYCAILTPIHALKNNIKPNRAIAVAWAMAVLTALPALWLYEVDDEMEGIQVCMFGTLGQAAEVKTFRSILFVLTYLIPGRFAAWFVPVWFRLENE